MLGWLWCKFVRSALLPALGLDEYRSHLKQVEQTLRGISTELDDLSNRVACVEEFAVRDEATHGS